jgi:hypothetical protein
MDNVVIIKIEGIEYEFKLKSSQILYLERKLARNIFETFQSPDFTVMCNIFFACANDACKFKYKTEGDLFDALLAEYGLQELSEKYLTEIVQKSGLVQKQKDIPMSPSEEVKEKTWNK